MKKLKYLFLAVGLLSWSSASAQAPSRMMFFSGNRLNEICPDSTNQNQDFAFCFGYIVGATDKAVANSQIGIGVLNICLPKNVRTLQMYDIVVTFIRANPAMRHLPGDVLVEEALTQAFDCLRRGGPDQPGSDRLR